MYDSNLLVLRKYYDSLHYEEQHDSSRNVGEIPAISNISSSPNYI
jgi:hypothetical protein